VAVGGELGSGGYGGDGDGYSHGSTKRGGHGGGYSGVFSTAKDSSTSSTELLMAAYGGGGAGCNGGDGGGTTGCEVTSGCAGGPYSCDALKSALVRQIVSVLLKDAVTDLTVD
jgi:hypothetical protein